MFNMRLVTTGFIIIALAIFVESRSAHRRTRQTDLNDDLQERYLLANGGIGNDNDFGFGFDNANLRTTTTRRPRTTRRVTTTTTTTATTPVNNQAAFQSCMTRCLTTPEHNPLCGTNRQTYNNIGQLTCAQNCGLDVQLLFKGTCSATG